MNLPIKFEDRMKKLLGDEYEEYLQSYLKPHFGGLRVNTLKISPEAFEQICPFSIKKIPWVKNGYYYDKEEQPSRHPYYYAGLYYIQEPSAMTPASLLMVEKGDKVLDICAAPGGKSTELGAKLEGEGVLISNDISNSRAKALLKNIELFGIRNAIVLSEAPDKLVQYFPEYFDKILIDAPCSGEGMFRKTPSIMKNWEQFGVDYYNTIQKEIILLAAKMLKPGGMMLYSTCTFSPEENEGTISYLLEQFPEFQVVNALPQEKAQKEFGLSYEGFDFGKPEWADGRDELNNCIRLWPHKIDGEGHFVALLHKGENEENAPEKSYYSSGMPDKVKSILTEEAKDFINNLKFPVNQELLEIREDKLYLLPEGLPSLKGLRLLRKGLLLGEMKQQRFEPSQALANALKISDYDKIIQFKADDPMCVRYLKCESIEPEGDYLEGWYLVCVEEFPLGWLKIMGNQYRNKYYSGWRWV
jgi:NOL1/NOP2/sun family putative RNA methylase